MNPHKPQDFDFPVSVLRYALRFAVPIFIVRILSLVALFAISVQSIAQPGIDTNNIKVYLGEHSEQIMPHKPVHMLDTIMRERSFFLFGEMHGSAEPHALDLQLFRQLHAGQGVRSYIAEVDETKAWMLNNFLEDGNEQWLRKVFSDWVTDTAQWASQENFDKWKGMRTFYQSLPKDQRFRVFGVDRVQNVALLKEHLAALISMGGAKRTTPYMDSLKRMTDTVTLAGRRSLAALCSRMITAMSTNIRVAGTTGRNHQAFLRFVTSLSYMQPGVSRDSIMYQNMLHIARENALADQPLYGFIGFYHALMTGYNHNPPFASLLEHGEESPFAGKVTSALMMTIDSKMMLPLLQQMRQMMPSFVIEKAQKSVPGYSSSKYIPFDASSDGAQMKIPGGQLFRSLTQPSSTTIFRLDAPASPFERGKLLAEVSGFQSVKMDRADDKTLDAVQYVILFRNAGAAHELK